MRSLDLTAARADSGALGAKLANLIWRVESAASACIDLDRAADVVAFSERHGAGADLQTVDPVRQAENRDAVQSGVMAAVILYCRATGTSSDERKEFQFATNAGHPLYDSAERIRNLRNGVLGHWGGGGELVRNPWNKHALILDIDPDGLMSLSLYGNMVFVDGDVISDLNLLIPAAAEWMHARKIALSNELLNELQALTPAQESQIEKCPHHDLNVTGRQTYTGPYEEGNEGLMYQFAMGRDAT